MLTSGSYTRFDNISLIILPSHRAMSVGSVLFHVHGCIKSLIVFHDFVNCDSSEVNTTALQTKGLLFPSFAFHLVPLWEGMINELVLLRE